MLFSILRSALSGNSVSFTDILVRILSSLFVIFCTMPIHEYAHALASNKLGDPTARYNGRLTLNPLAHIDYLGALLILCVGFGYAKPVPVNQLNFKNPKRDMAIVAAAGPLSNLIVALAALLIGNIVYTLFYFGVVASNTVMFMIFNFFHYVAVINISLAAFNLIPIPPLDGSRVLFALTPNRFYYTVMQYERYISLALMILVFAGALNVPLSYIVNALYSGVSYIAALPFKALGVA